MADFHGVFPYLVSPVDGSGEIRTEVLGRLCDDLIKAGVTAFKIEGRQRSRAYVKAVVSAYREAVDTCFAGGQTVSRPGLYSSNNSSTTY